MDKKITTNNVKTETNKKVIPLTKSTLVKKPSIKKSEVKVTTKKTVIKKSTTTAKVIKPVIAKTIKPVTITQLPKEIFNVKLHKQAIFDTIISQRASLRQGTHQVKNRSAVAGGGIKPWRQKGTGRARAGSLSSPIFRSGGVIFGPQKNRNYKLGVNKKVKQLAFKSALSSRAKENNIFIADLEIKTPSTKKVINFLKTVDLKKKQTKILFISDDTNLAKSTSNLQKINTVKLNSLSVENILHYDVLIFSKKAIIELERRK